MTLRHRQGLVSVGRNKPLPMTKYPGSAAYAQHPPLTSRSVASAAPSAPAYSARDPQATLTLPPAPQTSPRSQSADLLLLAALLQLEAQSQNAASRHDRRAWEAHR